MRKAKNRDFIRRSRNYQNDALSFLIDECEHPSLVSVANELGFSAYHVDHLGLKGCQDWRLWQRALQSNLILVTNNARDFRKLSSVAEIHPGLILILPNARSEVQRDLFRIGLQHLTGRTNLINRVIEIDLQAGKVEIREFEIP